MTRQLFLAIVSCIAVSGLNIPATMADLPRITIDEAGTGFKTADGKPFIVWGVNYDHDQQGLLIEDYWTSDWPRVVEDFKEIKALGANVVRVHLQVNRFMESATEPNSANLQQLEKLLALADEIGLYLDLTGLGCYHKQDTPAWYDGLDEAARWDVQARFWQNIATAAKPYSSVFCYDLMNEPILPGEKPETEWLTGELGGKHFVQRISLALNGRTREEVAAAWVQRMTKSIRDVDSDHLVTVGAIPWAMVFPKAKPLFYGPEVGKPLDFVSVHFYPESGKIAQAVEALQVYQVGKPLVIEEFFPLKCSLEEAEEFLGKAGADGVVSFYWGATVEENLAAGGLQGAIVGRWLEFFRDKGYAALTRAAPKRE